jgi:uncharacterized protein
MCSTACMTAAAVREIKVQTRFHNEHSTTFRHPVSQLFRSMSGDSYSQIRTLRIGALWQTVEMDEGLISDAEQGDSDAACLVGVRFENSGDLVSAERWYRRAAEGGSHLAMESLAFLLHVRGGTQEALHWWHCAASEGSAEAAYSLGSALEELGDPVGAERWYRVAAGAGLRDAAVDLGTFLAQQGRDEGRRWLEPAAGAGEVDAQRLLGYACQVLGDMDGARYWLRRAAEGGDLEAACSYGMLLVSIHGDVPEAMWWLQHAARAGDPDAAQNLGEICQVRRRGREAKRWFQLAAHLRAAPH